MAVREYSELVDRPFTLKKDGGRARARCKRKDCSFKCNVRHGWWAAKEEDGQEKAVLGWGVVTFHQHCCLLSRESKDVSYPCKVSALVLLKEARNLATFTQEKAKLILKPYFRRCPSYNYIQSCRCDFEEMLYGLSGSRLFYLPDIAYRIRQTGHFCEFSTINATHMKKLVLKRAEPDHNRKYKDAEVKPTFDKSTVDVSSILEHRRYLYSSWSFAPSTSVKQSYFLNEPNGEVDFCQAKSRVGGTFAYEYTTDADRHIVLRLAYYCIEDESAEVWRYLFRTLKKVYPNLNNEQNVQKVDGAKGCWAVFDKESKKIPWTDVLQRSRNAATKFVAKYGEIYKRIAMSRSITWRDKLLGKQSKEFQT